MTQTTKPATKVAAPSQLSGAAGSPHSTGGAMSSISALS